MPFVMKKSTLERYRIDTESMPPKIPNDAGISGYFRWPRAASDRLKRLSGGRWCVLRAGDHPGTEQPVQAFLSLRNRMKLRH